MVQEITQWICMLAWWWYGNTETCSAKTTQEYCCIRLKYSVCCLQCKVYYHTLYISTCTTGKNKLHGFRYDKCGGHNWTDDQKMVSQCVTHSCWFTVLWGWGWAVVIVALTAHHMPIFVVSCNTTSWTTMGLSADQYMLFWESTYPLKWLQTVSMGSISPSCTTWRICCFMIFTLKFVLMLQTHLLGVPGEPVIFLEMSSIKCQFHLVYFSVNMSSICYLAALNWNLLLKALCTSK